MIQIRSSSSSSLFTSSSYIYVFIIFITFVLIFTTHLSVLSYCCYHYELNYVSSDLLSGSALASSCTFKYSSKQILISRKDNVPNYKDVLVTDSHLVFGTICAWCVVLSVAHDFLHVGRGIRIESQEQMGSVLSLDAL